MGVSFKWDNPEKTALVLEFNAPWQWREYEILSHEIQRAFDSVEHKVDLIIDLRNAGDIPKSIMYELRDAYAGGMSNLDQYIFVGADAEFVKDLDVADRYFTAMGGFLSYDCVETMANARRIIRWKQLLRAYQSA